MKKQAIFTILLSLFVVAGFAQEKNEISVEVLQPIIEVANGNAIPIDINYERVLNASWVFVVSPILQDATPLSLDLWVEFDWHPADKGLYGFFIGPAISLPMTFSAVNGNSIGIDLGGAIGYQFLLAYNIDIDLALGVPLFGLTNGGPWGGSQLTVHMTKGLVMVGYRF